MAGGVYVSGLREFQRALKNYDGKLKDDLKTELQRAGDIVAAAAPERFQSATKTGIQDVTGFQSTVLSGRVVVRPSVRSKHKRGDFGSLLFRQVLYPTLVAKEPDITAELEAILDRLALEEGF